MSISKTTIGLPSITSPRYKLALELSPFTFSCWKWGKIYLSLQFNSPFPVNMFSPLSMICQYQWNPSNHLDMYSTLTRIIRRKSTEDIVKWHFPPSFFFVNEISRLCLLMDFHQDQESRRFLTEVSLILNPLTAESNP